MQLKIILVLAVLTLSCSDRSEQALIDGFTGHKEEFELLVSMMNHDSKIVHISNEQVFFTNGQVYPLADVRFAGYQTLLRELRLYGGIHRSNDDYLSFNTRSPGLFFGRSSKAIIYTTTSPTPLVESVDKYQSWFRDQPPVYRHIVGDWYLSYESW